MVPLWSEVTRQTTIKKNEPSPTKNTLDFARNRIALVEGPSLRTLLNKSLAASMTIEAVLAMPLFLSFILCLSGFLEAIQLHSSIQYALWNAGNQIALYAAAPKTGAVVSLLSPSYIKGQITESLGKSFFENAPLKNGEEDLLILVDCGISEMDILKITVRYPVSLFGGILPFPAFSMSHHFVAHLWNGYGVDDEPAQEVVYMTQHGRVYHVDRDCTYLSVTVEEIPASSLDAYENESGRHFGACAWCAEGEMPATLYITKEGEAFHYQETCIALKRTVYALPLSEAAKKSAACSRCGR
jgi:hypothetical protein